MAVCKVSIIGVGSVGSSIAFALIQRNVPVELMLSDVDKLRAEGDFMDLSDAAVESRTKVKLCEKIEEAGQADIIIIAAGAKQLPHEKRSDLMGRNATLTAAIIESIRPINPNAILLLVTNPVDALCTVAKKTSGLPYTQVIGSGTVLDTRRLRHLLSEILHISTQSIHCDVLGEHGDHQFVGWSGARIGGADLLHALEDPSKYDLEQVAEQAKARAYEIFTRKGATFYGIASCAVSIVESIVYNLGRVFPITCYSEKFDSYVCLPAAVGREGVTRILNVSLNEEETTKLQVAVGAIKNTV